MKTKSLQLGIAEDAKPGKTRPTPQPSTPWPHQQRPLPRTEGILQPRKGEFRVVLSIDLIQRSIAVEVDVADLVPVPVKRNS